MLAGLVEKIILNYFGDYIENFEKDKISLGVSNRIFLKLLFFTIFQIWSGYLEMKDILIKPSAINKLNLPFNLLLGKITKIDVYKFIFIKF